jgi:hypothetical protein
MLEQIFYLLDNTMEPLGGPDSLLRRQPAAAEYNPSGTVSAQANQFLVRLPWLDEDFYPATGVDVYEHPFCVERSFGRFCQINVPTLIESTDEHIHTPMISARYHCPRCLALLSLQSDLPRYNAAGKNFFKRFL